MFADLIVADGKLLAQLEVFRIYKRFVIDGAKEKLALLVAALHAYPYPLAEEPRSLCCKFNLHVVAVIVLGHVAPRILSVDDASA